MSKKFDRILVIDFETFWDSKEFSLSFMTTEAYVRDPRFHAFGCCIHEYGDTRKAQWYGHSELHNIFSTYDWSRTAVAAQNASFDCAILSWIYDVHPCFIFDTLSMARAVRGVEAGNSLKKLAEYYELPPKGNAVHSTNGVRVLTKEVERELAEYCAHDVFLCEEIMKRLLVGYPKKELELIDMTIRMFTEPKLVLDAEMLQDAKVDEDAKLAAALERSGVEESTLASNDKFAELLRSYGVEPPTKISKQTGKPAFALAKSDAHFQQLLNGDNEEVALLCEARLKVKSTQARTRAQRFLDIASRGALPVPLNYFGAETGRWVGTQQVNLQNMKRGGFLRKAIMAPEGHAIVVGDLSQIEPRVIAWLADYDELLSIFNAGGDPYATFGEQMFSMPGLNKEEHPLLRQSAKSALLGCFGPETPVLTSRGYVPIIEVSATDLLWDGTEWIQHQGLLSQGEKEVQTRWGLSATADHKILVGNKWHEWQEVHTSPSLLKQALSSVSLPVSSGAAGYFQTGTHSTSRGCAAPAEERGFHRLQACSAAALCAALSAVTEQCGHLFGMGKEPHYPLRRGLSSESLPASGGTHRTYTKYQDDTLCSRGCAAPADGRVTLNGPICGTEEQHAATHAQKQKGSLRYLRAMDTKLSALIRRIGSGCRTASVQSLFAAQTRLATRTLTMVAGASQYILRGLQTVWSSFGTLLPSTAGITPRYSLIAGTTALGMPPATYALSHAASTWPTSARSQCAKSRSYGQESPCLKERMQTYDILCAGPRNRYTVLTSEGPIVVHNCGYGLGWANFAAQLLVGFLGAKPLRYTKEDAQKFGVTQAHVEKFLEWDKNLQQMAKIPHTCTDRELLIHCLAAKAIVDKYRVAAAPVKDFWEFLSGRIQRSLIDGTEYNHKDVLLFRKEEIVLASGMSLKYPNLRAEKEVDEETGKATGSMQYVYELGNKKQKLYGGRLANHVTQSTARVVMTDAMLRAHKKYQVLFTVHDEFGIVVPEAEAEEATKWVYEQMVVEPKWLPGIPLDADVGYHRRYGLAKG